MLSSTTTKAKAPLALRLTVGVLLGGCSFWLSHRALLAVAPLEGAVAERTQSSTLSAPPAHARHVLAVDGRERGYQLHRPSAAASGAPLWLVLHGSGGTGDEMRRLHGGAFDRLAAREGIVIAYPDGYEEHWNDCRPRADYAANLENVDDVAFVQALLETLHVEEGIDLERVTVIGISNGGHMVFRLAYEVPEIASAYVALLANLPAEENDDCRHSDVPVAMLLINGSEDPINPASGGVVNLAGNVTRGAVLSAEATARRFAERAGYGAPPRARSWTERAPDDGTAVESWRYFEPGRPPVEWIRVIGGGHSVPTTGPLPELPPAWQAAVRAEFGPQSTEFETVEIIFDFSSSVGASLL